MQMVMTSDETQIQCSAVQINNRPFLNCLRHSGFSVLQIWPMFGSIFRFSHLKTAVFRFWCRFAGFLEFFFWFPVFINNDGGFSELLSSVFYDFSGFDKEVTPRSNSKGPFI